MYDNFVWTLLDSAVKKWQIETFQAMKVREKNETWREKEKDAKKFFQRLTLLSGFYRKKKKEKTGKICYPANLSWTFVNIFIIARGGQNHVSFLDELIGLQLQTTELECNAIIIALVISTALKLKSSTVIRTSLLPGISFILSIRRTSVLLISQIVNV